MIIDGATNWGETGHRPAAEGFDLEARRTSIYEWVRQVRGGVLAGAFTVERHLSATIIHFVLGDRLNLQHVAETFDEGLLGPLTFERRINVVLMIAPHLLPEAEVATLKGELSDLRSLRNAMAHKPFWYHPELDDDGCVANLVPMVMRGKAPLPLTTAFIEQANTRMTALIDRVVKLAALAARQGRP